MDPKRNLVSGQFRVYITRSSVLYTRHLVSLGWIGHVVSLVKQECIQSFGEENFWETATCLPKEEVGGKH